MFSSQQLHGNLHWRNANLFAGYFICTTHTHLSWIIQNHPRTNSKHSILAESPIVWLIDGYSNGTWEKPMNRGPRLLSFPLSYLQSSLSLPFSFLSSYLCHIHLGVLRKKSPCPPLVKSYAAPVANAICGTKQVGRSLPISLTVFEYYASLIQLTRGFTWKKAAVNVLHHPPDLLICSP